MSSIVLAGSTGAAFTDEVAQDRAAELFTNGVHSGISFVYVDGSSRIDAVVSGAAGGVAPMAVESDAGVAVGNSGNTNRVAFNTWASANPGKPIFIRAGTYDFAGGGLNPKGPVWGAGIGVTVLRFPEQSVSNIYVINVDNWSCGDFTILSTSTATPDATGINDADSNHLTLDHCTNFLIRGIETNGAANMCIHVRDVHRGTIANCSVLGSTRDGIHVTSGSTDVSVIGNHIWQTGDDGIAIISYNADAARNQRINVQGNTIGNVFRARGITVEGGQDVTVDGNTIQTTVSNGILVNSIGSSQADTWGTINCQVTDNIITGTGGDGIHVNGKTTGVVLRGNKISSPTGGSSAGIRVITGRVIIEGNTIDDAVENAIFFPTSNVLNDESVIRFNTIRRPAKRGVYALGASKLTVSGNIIQEPSQNGSAWSGIYISGGSQHSLINNRVDATNSTLTPFAIELNAVTGAQVALTYAPNAGALLTQTGGTTGVITT